jgi:hypothetical protein
LHNLILLIECPFEIYEILINPVGYQIQQGDEALVFATDYSHASQFGGNDTDEGKDEKDD